MAENGTSIQGNIDLNIGGNAGKTLGNMEKRIDNLVQLVSKLGSTADSAFSEIEVSFKNIAENAKNAGAAIQKVTGKIGSARAASTASSGGETAGSSTAKNHSRLDAEFEKQLAESVSILKTQNLLQKAANEKLKELTTCQSKQIKELQIANRDSLSKERNSKTRRSELEFKRKKYEDSENYYAYRNKHPEYFGSLRRTDRYQTGNILNKAGDLINDGSVLGFMAGKTLNAAGLGLMISPLAGFGAAILGAIEGVKKFGQATMDTYGRIESVKTQLSVVAGSDASAETLFGDISSYAKKSPFGVEQTSEMAVLLKQSGVYASDLMDTLKMIGDMAGGNAEKMKRIANNYAQIVSIGKASMLDMRQFAYAGIPIFEAVSKELGVSQERLRKMISDGEVTSEIIEKVFKNLTGVNGVFENATEMGAKTLQARIQNLQDAKELATAQVGKMIYNVGDKNGTGGNISGLVNFSEKVYEGINSWSEKRNIATNLEQIKNNRSETANIVEQIKYLKDNKKALEDKDIDVNSLLKNLEERLKVLGGAFSPDDVWGLYAQIYKKEEADKAKAQSSLDARKNYDSLAPYIREAGIGSSYGPADPAVLNAVSSLGAMNGLLDKFNLNDFSGKTNGGDVMQAISAGVKPDEIGQYFIASEFLKRRNKLGDLTKMNPGDAGKQLLSILQQMSTEGLAWDKSEQWVQFTKSLIDATSARDNAMSEGKASKILNAPHEETSVTGYSYEENMNSADALSKSLENLAKQTDSVRSVTDRFDAVMKQSSKYQQEQREKEIEQYKEYNRQVKYFTEKYSGNSLFSSAESYKGMSIADMAKYLTKFGGREVIKQNASSHYDSAGRVTEYGKDTWSYLKKTIPFIKETLSGYFKDSGEENPDGKAQEILGDITKILDIDVPTSKDFDKAAVWIREMAENTQSLSGDIKTVVTQLLLTRGNAEGKPLDLSYLEDSSGSNGDNFIPLWKRILSQHTGISTNNISGTKQTLDAYSDYKSTQGMANSMLTNMLKESGNTRLFSKILSPKMTAGGNVFSTKGSDGKEAHVYQADWKQVRENLKKFAFSLSASTKSAELYESALESEKDTFASLLADAYTVTDSADVSSTKKYISNTQLAKFSDNEAAQLFTDFGEELKTELGEDIADIKNGVLYGKDSAGQLVKLQGKQIEITGNINDYIEKKLDEKSAEISEASMNTLAKKIQNAIESVKLNGIVLPMLYGKTAAAGGNAVNEMAKNESLYTAEVNKQIGNNADVKNEYGDEETFNKAVTSGDEKAVSILSAIAGNVAEIAAKYGDNTGGAEKDAQGARNYGQIESLNNENRSKGFDWGLQNPGEEVNQSTSFGKADKFSHWFGADPILSQLGVEGNWSQMEKTVNETTAQKYTSGPITDDMADGLREQGVDESYISALQNENTTLEERKSIYDEIAEAANNAGQQDFINKSALTAAGLELKNMQSRIAGIGKEAAKSAFTSTFEAAGAAIIKGGDALDDWKDNLKQIGASMLQQVGSAMTTAGFNIAAYGAQKGSLSIIAGGLALAAAGGVISGFGGALASAEDNEDEDEDETARLEALKDDLKDLLAQAREDAVYYESTLSHKKALSANSNFTTQSVNDAIITPSGNVISTHPDDYLIATKTPETLVGRRSGAPTVNFQVIDKSTGIKVTQQQSSYNEEKNEIDYTAIIESKVQEIIATSKGDEAFSAREARLRGRMVVM